MLVLTETATELVKSVMSDPQAADGTGVRIMTAGPDPEGPNALQLATAAGPSEGDQIIEAAGARVFVEPRAAAYLEDKVLDARLDEQGQAQFLLSPQTQ